jgi:hypothetical protein
VRRLRSKSGIGMVDALVTACLLCGVGLIFGVTFSSGFSAVRQSGDNSRAVALAQQKLEQVRSIPFEDLSYIGLRSGYSKIDATPSTTPFSFTSIDNVAGVLPGGTGTLNVVYETSSMKRVVITVGYTDSSGVSRQVVVRTLIADKRPRVGA